MLGVVEDIRVVGDAGERTAVEQRLHIAADDGGYRDAVTALHYTDSYTRSVYSRRIGAYEEIDHVIACCFGATNKIEFAQSADRFKRDGFLLAQTRLTLVIAIHLRLLDGIVVVPTAKEVLK